jgi:hypothetical protein
VYVHRKEVTLKSVRTPDRVGGVPNQPRSPHRSVRFSDEDWADLDSAAKALGTDRGTLLKEFTHWFLRRKGARLPERPAVSDWKHDDH